MMYSDEHSKPVESLGPDWDKIDDLLSQIARLSKSDLPAEDFYGQVLGEVRQGLAAAGAALWRRDGEGRPRVVAQSLPADAWPPARAAARARLIGHVLHSARAGVLPPFSAASGDAPAGNPTAYAILVCPWVIEGEAAGAIELLQPPGAASEIENGYLKLLEAIGELLADYQRSGQIRELRERLQAAARLERFGQAIHARTELRPVAYAIVNEGKQLLGCDRISLLIKRRKRFRLLAVSGVDTIHPKAKVVALLKKLAAAAATAGEPLWFPDGPAETGKGGKASPAIAPQVEAVIERFLDDSHAKEVAVLPLRLPEADGKAGELVGMLVAERFYGTIDPELRTNPERICGTWAQALRNAREAADVPLAGLLRRMKWLTTAGGLAKLFLLAAVVAGGAAALTMIPADFDLPAHGELQPQAMRDVFAEADGLISDLHAEHGQKVQQGELLAALHRPQTDLEMRQIVGELATARERLASVEAERLQIPRETEEQQRQYHQLTAEAEDLNESIRNLEAQRAIVLDKQKELQVRSPMSGQILTWNVRQLLDARPVRRGQVLLTIGDLSGKWQLDLKVRDREAAHLLAAQRELGDGLDVTFALDADPARRLHGTIRRVALRTETPEGQEPSLAVTVDVPRDELPQLTAGATVTAHIHCGRRAIGYVWLHDTIDAVRGWLWF